MNMKKKVFLGIMAAVAVGGCTQQDMVQQAAVEGLTFAPSVVASEWNNDATRAAVQPMEGAGRQLYLHTMTAPTETPLTRGAKYTHDTFQAGESFHVSGYRYGEDQTVGSVAEANFMWNAEVTKSDGWWKANQTFFMPLATDKIDFFAWFTPSGTSGVTPVNAAGGLQLQYALPASPENQPDLLTAVYRNETFNGEANHTVPLAFQHELTAVNIVVDDNVAPGTINEVAFLNVYTGGTLTVGDKWTLTSAPEETAYTTSFSTVDDGNLLVDADHRVVLQNLMMIPQQFTEATQKLRVKMTVDGDQKTLFADLKTDNEATSRWVAGTTVTYKISTSDVNVLRIAGINYPGTDTWGNAFVRSAYVSGNTLGLYAINAEGNVVVDNRQLTYNGTSWDTGGQLFLPGLKWFMYSPYKAEGLAHNGTKDGVVVTTADDFFADGIAAWSPNAKQDTEADLLAQDLQVGTGVETVASTLRFDMAHTMGLVHLSIPASADVPNLVYFDGNEGTSSTTRVSTSSETTTVAPSRSFTTNKPYDKGDNLFLFIARPGDVTLAATTTNQYNAWDLTNNTASVTKNVAANSYVTHEVTNKFLTRNYIKRGWAYAYSKSVKTFTAPANGSYIMECWGAEGGSSGVTEYSNGMGGYTQGAINLSSGDNFYVYVGQQGSRVSGQDVYDGAGWNGGGAGHDRATADRRASGGGGATDIRLVSGNWNNASSLRSRIMVAAGGGGALQQNAGNGGGINGLRGSTWNGNGYGASQIAGGAGATATHQGEAGGFGYGGKGEVRGSGGGGGYYGGGGGAQSTTYDGSGGGGSSYISGHPGCIAITSASSTSPKGGNSTTSNLTVERATHYTGTYFTETKMIDGEGYNCKSTNTTSITRTAEQMPNPSGGLYATGKGHTGNGYARITENFIE